MSQPVDETSNGGAAPKRSDLFPRGIPFIVGNEGAERFSYYGMRAILYIHLAALYVHFVPTEEISEAVSSAANAKATAVAHLFMAGVYAFPMIGAILSDRLLGKYKVIFWVSLIYCLGNMVVASAGQIGVLGNYEMSEWGVYLGLALIAIGSGGIKPCVSANVGDQFTAKNAHLVTQIFQIFYFIINFGSFFSTLLTPLLYVWYGPGVAFGVPGVFMALATFVFWLGRNKFVHVPPNPGGRLGGLDFSASVLLFTPVIALIVAVFVYGGHFEVGAASAEMSGAAFYADYLQRYVVYLAAHSWPWFLGAAILVVVGLGLFNVRQKSKEDTGFLAVLVYSFQHRKEREKGMGFFDVARAHFGDEAAEGPPAVLRIMLVFCMVSVFWALFDQHASTWIEQARQMDRVISVPYNTSTFVVGAIIAMALYGGTWLFLWISNRKIPRKVNYYVFAAVAFIGLCAIASDLVGQQWREIELEAAQIAALNPLMVMIIIPLMNVAVYGPLEKRGIPLKPLQKMALGMFLAAAAFAIAATLQGRIEAAAGTEAQVHVLWQVLQYVVMTTAEVLVSITGLEFAYTQAPRAMKSTIMGFWLLCVTAGNVLVAFLAPMQNILALSQFFWVFTGLMLGAALIFTLMANLYRGKTYLQEEAA